MLSTHVSYSSYEFTLYIYLVILIATFVYELRVVDRIKGILSVPLHATIFIRWADTSHDICIKAIINENKYISTRGKVMRFHVITNWACWHMYTSDSLIHIYVRDRIQRIIKKKIFAIKMPKWKIFIFESQCTTTIIFVKANHANNDTLPSKYLVQFLYIRFQRINVRFSGWAVERNVRCMISYIPMMMGYQQEAVGISWLLDDS